MAMNYGGIMYFPLNVSFFEDTPIELVEAKYGLAGVGAVMKLLCKLHKEKGYYLTRDKEQCTLFAHKAGEGNAAQITGNSEQSTERQEQNIERQGQSSANRMLNEENCMQPVDIFTENADNSEQSKVKETKLKETKAEIEGRSPGENSFLTPPEYAYNKQTHNYDGLMFTLQQMRITNPEEVNAILRLSDYGRLRGYVWQVIHSTRWGEVIAKGKYMVSALVKERKKTGS